MCFRILLLLLLTIKINHISSDLLQLDRYQYYYYIANLIAQDRQHHCQFYYTTFNIVATPILHQLLGLILIAYYIASHLHTDIALTNLLIHCTQSYILMSAQNVIDAVNIISSQQGSQEQLHQANMIISTVLGSHDFKFMFDIGSHLIINKQDDPNVLNFALKLIETGVRLHWQCINNETRDMLKAFLESILGRQDSHEEIKQPILIIDHRTPRHILNSLSKCYCEVIKCDWPQRWPKLFDKLLSTKRNLVVIFILLRLAEDVGTFCEPPNNTRRREISQGLNNKMIDIYLYLVDCISSQNYDLMKASLDCLTALSIWAQFNQDLAKYLCQFIKNCNVNQGNHVASVSELEIRKSAAEVLVVCLERKHSKIDSIDVRTSLFEDETNLHNLISCLQEIHQSSLQESTQEKLEFEKRLCQILTHIARYVHIGPPEKPQNLADMYSVMKIVLSHPSITVSIQAVNFWLKVFSYAPKKPLQSITHDLTASLLIICANKLIKSTYDSHLYGFELDCQQEFDVFQFRYRADLCELCRFLTVQNERICFELVYNSLAKALQHSNTNLNEWDALASLSASVCSKLSDINLYYTNGVELIKSLLLRMDQGLIQASNVQTESSGAEASLIPDLISSQLSCVSALCAFLPNWHQSDKELTKQVLNKIIILAFHRPDKSVASSRQLVGTNTRLLANESFLKGFRALSRHASASFVRICLNHSKHLLDIFPDLKRNVDTLFATATDNPFSSEKCQLYEGLTLIGNEESNDIVRKNFALELFNSIEWFKDYELKCDQFIDFVGLNRTEPEPELSVLAQQNMISQQSIPRGQLNRVKLTYVVSFIYALTRRISSKQTLLPELLSFVKPILSILHSMNSLWLPEMQVKCLKEYAKNLFAPVSVSYRQQLLDSLMVSQKSSGTGDMNQNSNDTSGDTLQDSSNKSLKGEAQYIELFSWNFYEALLNCFGSIVHKASPEIFGYINNIHLQTALTGAEYLPPLKLHKLIKNFVMPLVNVCSQDQILIQHHLLPLLSNLLPFMFNKLDSEWKAYRDNDSPEEAGPNNSQNDDVADEMIRNHLLRNLSIDFIDLMNLVLIEKIKKPVNECVLDADDSRLQRSLSSNDIQNSKVDQKDVYKLSNLGLNLLTARPDFVIIVSTSTLTWSDSSINSKSIFINSNLFKHLLNANLIKTTDETSLLFRSVITSLGMFGEHEQNCSGLVQLFLQLYEGLKQKLVNFPEYVSQMTSIDINLFEEYERKTTAGNEKVKRAHLRKVLDKLIGKNIGQRYSSAF